MSSEKLNSPGVILVMFGVYVLANAPKGLFVIWTENVIN